MRVLCWSDAFWPLIGGVEVLTARLLLALRERGFKVAVVTSHRGVKLPDTGHYKGIPIYRFPFFTALAEMNVEQLIAIRLQVAELKRDFAPHLVHIQMTPVSLSGMFHLNTAHVHPAPLLITLHGAVAGLAAGHNSLLGHTLHSAAWIAANSQAVLAEARQLSPEISLRSSVIYNGANLPAFAPAPPPSGAPMLLCLGRLSQEKGFDVVLTALAALRDELPQAHLVIAGDGPVRPELERQVTALGLTQSVRFLGWVAPEQMPALINTATLVVVPSRQEGFGLAALEAALMARPVVATRVGGLPEVVLHEQTGLLVEPEDSTALAAAIAWLLDRPERATQMGQAARRRAQEVFSWERCVDAYDALYRKLSTKEAAHVEFAESPAPQ